MNSPDWTAPTTDTPAPPPSVAQLELELQHRVFWFVATTVCLTQFGFGLACALVPGRAPHMPILAGHAATVLVALVLMAVVAGTGAVRAAMQALLSITFLSSGAMVLKAGDLGSPAFWGAAALPLVALLAGAGVLGLTLSALFCGLLVATYCLQTQGGQPLPRGPASPEYQLAAILIIHLVVVTLAWMMLRGRQVLQRSLESARSTAQEAAQVKTRFLANMSHEIRTPLNGLVGTMDLLRSPRLDDVQRRQLLRLQEHSVNTVVALVNDILDWSKLEAGKVAIERREFNLRALVFKANETFSLPAFDKGIELTSSCDPAVARSYLGDPLRVAQIVNNLVSNAIKFTQRGGVHIHFGIEPASSPSESAMVRIDVTDSGMGIAPDKLANLFHAFTQADASITRRFGGTGLGLAISDELTRLMDGRIEVSSQPGHGSRFSLLLPLPARQPAAAPHSAPVDTMSWLVSDNAGLQRHVEALMAELGAPTHTSAHWPSSEELKLAGVDLLLVDGRHPLVPAAAAWQAWAEPLQAAGIRVALLATLSQQAHAAAGVTPPTELIYKPVRRASLRALIDRGATPSFPSTGPDRLHRAPLNCRVLLVDDNPVNQLVAQAMLADMGVQSQTASDGKQAVTLFCERRFDLVLMDIQMPVMDGIAATQTIRAYELHQGRDPVPMIAMTADVEPTEARRCREAGLDDFLAKPFDMEHLHEILERWCGPEALRRRQLVQDDQS
jgi:signal transduction histidine kinase/CheY-like chemotaxis protein